MEASRLLKGVWSFPKGNRKPMKGTEQVTSTKWHKEVLLLEGRAETAVASSRSQTGRDGGGNSSRITGSECCAPHAALNTLCA